MRTRYLNVIGPAVEPGSVPIELLHHVWAEHRHLTDPVNGPVDPVRVLQSTGALLRAVDEVMTARQACNVP